MTSPTSDPQRAREVAAEEDRGQAALGRVVEGVELPLLDLRRPDR